MNPKASQLNNMSVVPEEALSTGRNSVQALKQVDDEMAGQEGGEQEMKEDDFDDNNDPDQKQLDLDRGKISTRELKRRVNRDEGDQDQTSELDPPQTVPQVEILDQSGKFMMPEGDEETDNELQREEQEEALDLL